jgi:transcriptional regulator with XRE-family HTH domain
MADNAVSSAGARTPAVNDVMQTGPSAFFRPPPIDKEDLMPRSLPEPEDRPHDKCSNEVPPVATGPTALGERLVAPRPRRGRECDSEPQELAAFTASLELLRQRSHVAYEVLHERTGYSKSVLSKAASGTERPTLEVVLAFVKACGADPEEWTARWRTMSAAVDRYQQELLTMADMPYEQLDCPASPARFNRQLQLRVCRVTRQATVAGRANYAPSTVSGVFKVNRLANAEFVKRILQAVDASQDEIDTWLAWRSQLAKQTRGGTEQHHPPTAGLHRRVSKRKTMALIVAVIALAFVGSVSVVSAAVVSVARAIIEKPTNDSANAASPSEVSPTPSLHSRLPNRSTDDGRQYDRLAPHPSRSSAKVHVNNGTQPAPTPAVTEGPTVWTTVPATVVGKQLQMGGAQSAPDGRTVPRSGDTVQIICMTTKTEPRGWYYTDQQYFVNPTSVRFSGNDQDRVPACNEISFPETAWAPPAPEMPCLVRLQLLSCDVVAEILDEALA